MADNTTFKDASGASQTAAADDIGGVLWPRVKVAHGADGAATDVSTASPLPVTLANTGANATAVKVDGSAVTQPVSGTVTATAVGGVAHDAVDSGSPIKIGVVASRARRTAVSADGDRVDLNADRYGRLKISGRELSVAALQATASGDTTLIAAPGASTRLFVVRVEASNSHATTALTVGLKSASLNGGAVFGKRFLPAAGGAAVWSFPDGHLMCGVNELFAVNLSAGGQIEFTVYYETVAD